MQFVRLSTVDELSEPRELLLRSDYIGDSDAAVSTGGKRADELQLGDVIRLDAEEPPYRRKATIMEVKPK